MPRRSSLPRRLSVVAGTLAGLLVAAGCSGDGSGDSSGPSPSPSETGPTPLSEVRTTEIAVARADFCAQVAPDAVEAALGAVPVRAERWRNGQRARLAEGVTDVAHEYGCRWRARGGATATAWVFAPPVTRREARALRRDALGRDGCREAPDVPRFGRPTVAVQCRGNSDGAGGGVRTVAVHGLFGDAWLSCAVSSPGRNIRTLTTRAEQWCVDVVFAAEAPGSA